VAMIILVVAGESGEDVAVMVASWR
jgi:hypothetical protein